MEDIEDKSTQELNEIKNILLDLKNKLEKKKQKKEKISKKEKKEYEELLNKVLEKENKIPSPRFNGFTPEQMAKMIDCPFGPGCPVQLCNLSENEIESVPFMRQALYLMNLLREQELKLIQRYWIPSKIVEKLYELGSHIHSYDSRIKKTEENIHEVSFIREILYRLGLIDDAKGVMSLTAKGKELLSDPNALLHIILFYLLTEFDAGGFDYVSNSYNFLAGNLGRLYSLWVLHRFGDKQHDLDFYVNQYFTAFPFLLKENDLYYSCFGNPEYDAFKDTPEVMYARRIYENLFPWLGICEINKGEEHKGVNMTSQVNKTPLIDLLFSFEEPAKI